MALFVTLIPLGAKADVIYGQWCSPTGDLYIEVVGKFDGDTVKLPGGSTVSTVHDRHRSAFVVPDGEARAGLYFDAIQLHEEEIRVIMRPQKGGKELSRENWRRCRNVTS